VLHSSLWVRHTCRRGLRWITRARQEPPRSAPVPEIARDLARRIIAAGSAGGDLSVGGYSAPQWGAAINVLFDLERFDAARFALRRLAPLYPRTEFVDSLSLVLDEMPDSSATTDFHDDTSRELQVVRHAGARTAILCFCAGGSQRLGMPLNAFHRWVGRLPASVIYLRDFRNQFFLDGIPALGAGLQASLAGLRKILLELEAQRVLCFGVSVGGFAALYYGLQIRAARVAALCGAVTLEPGFNEHLRWTGAARRLTEGYPGLALDMVKEYTPASRAPQVSLVYGEQNWDDRLHAEYMASLACARLRPLPGFDGHNVVIELVRRGELAGLLDEFVADDA